MLEMFNISNADIVPQESTLPKMGTVLSCICPAQFHSHGMTPTKTNEYNIYLSGQTFIENHVPRGELKCRLPKKLHFQEEKKCTIAMFSSDLIFHEFFQRCGF